MQHDAKFQNSRLHRHHNICPWTEKKLQQTSYPEQAILV